MHVQQPTIKPLHVFSFQGSEPVPVLYVINMLYFTLIDNSIYSVDDCTYLPHSVICHKWFCIWYECVLRFISWILPVYLEIIIYIQLHKECRCSPGSVLILYTSAHVFIWNIPIYIPVLMRTFCQDVSLSVLTLMCQHYLQLYQACQCLCYLEIVYMVNCVLDLT